MDLATLRSMVGRDLTQPADGNQRVTAELLTDAINQVYVTLAGMARCFKRTFTLTSVSGQASYALPDDVLDVWTARYDGALLTHTTPWLLSCKNAAWDVAMTDTPKYEYEPDTTGALGLYPPTDQNGKVISVTAFVIPYPHADPAPDGAVLTLQQDADTPAFPLAYHELLAHAAVLLLASRYLLNDASAARVQAAQADYERLLPLFLKQVTA